MVGISFYAGAIRSPFLGSGWFFLRDFSDDHAPASPNINTILGVAKRQSAGVSKKYAGREIWLYKYVQLRVPWNTPQKLDDSKFQARLT